MVLAKGLRSRSRYCWAGTDKVASRAVSTLAGRDLTAFAVSFASAMRHLECKSGVSGVSPRFSAIAKAGSRTDVVITNTVDCGLGATWIFVRRLEKQEVYLCV